MSNELAKYLNSRRRHKTDVAVAKQIKIAKQNGLTQQDRDIKQPHRLAKHHAMDCGRPGCVMCGNPRKLFKQLTAQEKRMQQDVDKQTDKHSNGLPKDKHD
jgi:hypothetical protein